MIPIVNSLSVGDLKVLRKQLDRYALGEIAHVENVMAGERRSRTHRRLVQTETRYLQELEQESERRTDLETTERFELEAEISKQLKTEEKFSAGLDVSGGFGPVSVSAYVRYDRGTTTEESQRTSQRYAKEVASKAMESIKERVRTVREQIEHVETEEQNEHEFSNGSEHHISGVYRWIDKYYRMRVDDYGKRVIYDVTVPEPAALTLFRKLLGAGQTMPTEPPEPEMYTGLAGIYTVDPVFLIWGGVVYGTPVRLQPQMISQDNYAQLASKYGARGVAPPPAEFLVVSHSIAKELDAGGDFMVDGPGVRVPDGYQALSSMTNVTVKTWAVHFGPSAFPYPVGDRSFARIQIGTEHLVYPSSFSGFTRGLSPTEPFERAHAGEQGDLPITIIGNTVGAVAMNIDVTCQRTTQTYERWQLQTYEAIMAAYQKRLMDYQDEVSAARAGDGVRISGDNPERNLVAVRNELKRLFLQMWMGGDLFGLPAAILDGNATAMPPILPDLVGGGSVAINNSEAITFSEESFDWDNMSFTLLPYFHGRKSKWLDLSGYTDPDPIYENFLKAGAAAVRIPVRPEYTDAVLYYQLTGRIWPRGAGDIPALTDVSTLPEAEIYNDHLGLIDVDPDGLDEYRAGEIPADDPDAFVIKVPTSLVALPSVEGLNTET